MFDVLTIAAVTDELAATVLDGRIQRIGLVDPRTITAEIYAGGERRYLIASADDRLGRLHLTESMPSVDAQLITPFGLLLRKYVRGGILIGIDQPPLERLVRLSIAKRVVPNHGTRGRLEENPATDDEIAAGVDEEDEFADNAEVTYVHLMVELMGRHSNLILVDDAGKIMESAKRVTSSMSRVRPIQPRLPYTPPPAIDKPDPRRVTTAGIEQFLGAEPPGNGLARSLVSWLRGISPQMAKEIAFRATGTEGATMAALPPDAATLIARETRALFEPLLTSTWAPRVYQDDDDVVVAFAADPLGYLAGSMKEGAVPSISAAAALAMGSDLGDAASPIRHAQRRDRLLASIQAARERQQRRLHSVQEQQARAGETERLREWGDLIYAYLWQIEPGQAELRVDAAVVPLDPALSGKENAQHYFEQYRKAQGAGARTPELIAGIEADLGYLDQMRTLTEHAAGFNELEALAHEWESYSGKAPERGPRPEGARRRPQPQRPRPLLDDDGNAVYVGHSGNQNAQITFDLAGPNDTWLHARGVPGSHVIVRWRHPAGEERDATIEAAAALAAYYSAARGSAGVEVDVTRRRHVRKIRGSGPGMVTYRNERTIAVAPASERELTGVLGSREQTGRGDA
ncbi:MAG: NFACT family protein [Chloroflexota bacterium]|nr:NFACT family protein [Chloroflexota bacterium]